MGGFGQYAKQADALRQKDESDEDEEEDLLSEDEDEEEDSSFGFAKPVAQKTN